MQSIDQITINYNFTNQTNNHDEIVKESKHIQIIFTSVLVIYICCAGLTLTSFKELSLNTVENFKMKIRKNKYEELVEETSEYESSYQNEDQINTKYDANITEINIESEINNISLMEYFKNYFKTIILVPKPLVLLCITNYFCWSSLVCYSLYFTDFVAKEVFGGEPNILNKEAYLLYENGVRYGSICMAFYSLSCSIYSFLLDKIINKFK